MNETSALLPTASGGPERFPLPLGGPAQAPSFERLRRDIATHRRRFFEAAPFRHLVFDNLFSESLLGGIEAEFGDVPDADWVKWSSANQHKRGLRANGRLGPAAQAYFNLIHSGPFVEFLTELTGIKGLLPDPTLKSGGLHEIPQGGKFDIHVDFNRHPITGLDNRLVLITYLNRGWKSEYGAALELWNAEAKRCVKEIVPVFGRSVLFHESSRSWHGHPSPVNAPDGRPRRSIAAYYYSNGRDGAVEKASYKSHYIHPDPHAKRQKMAAAVKLVTPPIFIIAGKRLKRRLSKKPGG